MARDSEGDRRDETDGDRRDETDGEPRAPVVCEACGTTNRVPLSAVAEAIDRHNERVHGGEAVAEVDPAVRDALADLVARDIGLLDE